MVGPYAVEAQLASGSFGVVLRGRAPGSGRPVAIKRLHAGAEQLDPVERARFLREAEVMRALDHPAIVPLLDAGHDARGPYLVAALVEGPSLEEALKKGPLPPPRAAELARDLARAVAHAHARGVLHRDLKPANALLDEADRVYLTDFGLAGRQGLASSLTRTGELLGTPAYMAPEQARGRRAGPAADVYGLGATLYTMLTAAPPFGGRALDEVLERVCRDAPDPLRGRTAGPLDPTLERICLRCLEKDPGDRPPSAAALADALDAWLTRAAGERAAPARRPAPPSRGPLVAASAVLAGAGLVAAGLLLIRGDAPPPPPRSDARGDAPDPADDTPPPADAAASRPPASPHLAEARAALARGEPEAAEAALARALARAPQPEAYLLRGLIRLDRFEPGAAFRDLEVAREGGLGAEVEAGLAERIADADLRRLLRLAFVPDAGPLEEAALLVSRIVVRPGLRTAPHLEQLDALAARVAERVAAAGTPSARLARLVELVYAEGVQGAVSDYADPENSCLDRVLERGRGIQITCSIVLIAVGRRLGITLEGVCFPGRFMVRHEGPPLGFADPFDGRVVTAETLQRELDGSAGRPVFRPEHLEASPRRLILVRLTHFLAGRLAQRGDLEGARRAEQVVRCLAPRDTEAVVDRAFGRL